MIIPQSKAERAASAFLSSLLFIGLIYLGVAGAQRGWFDRKVEFYLRLPSAQDLHPGTSIQLNGVGIGRVSEVELERDGHVRVTLSVRDRFAAMVTRGSLVRVDVPLFMGDRTLTVLPGTGAREAAPPQSTLALDPSTSLLAYLQDGGMQESMDKLKALFANLEGISAQLNKSQRLDRTMANLDALTRDLKTAVPHYTRNASQLSGDLTRITQNLGAISDKINDIMPAVQEMAKAAPETTKALTESLYETKILVKALQRNLFIRGSAADVREEEEKARQPASAPPPPAQGK